MEAISSTNSAILPAAPARQQDQQAGARLSIAPKRSSDQGKAYVVTISSEARKAAAEVGKTAAAGDKQAAAVGTAASEDRAAVGRAEVMKKQKQAAQEAIRHRKLEERRVEEEVKLRARQEAETVERKQAEQKKVRRAEDEKQSRKETILDTIAADNRSRYANGIMLQFSKQGISPPTERSTPTIFSTTPNDSSKLFQQLKTRQGIAGISVHA